MKPLDSLPRMIDLLAAIADALPAELMRTRPADGSFSFVEHVWHIADLECEGFGVRIARLLAELQPSLSSFDGDRIAAERDYRSRDLAHGLARFAEARRENVARLRGLSDAEHTRSGTFLGAPILVADLPGRMLDHDRAHCAELAALLREIAPGHPTLATIVEAASDSGTSRAA
jgi:hypothetical protein